MGRGSFVDTSRGPSSWGAGCPVLEVCGFQTCLLPGVESPSAVWRSATCQAGRLTRRPLAHPAVVSRRLCSWPCALTSDSHPGFCSWREPLPALPWLRVLMSPCLQRLFRTESLLVGSCAHLRAPDSQSGAPESRIVAVCLVAEGCCSLLGVLQNWQCAWSRVHHFQLMCTGQNRKGQKGTLRK